MSEPGTPGNGTGRFEVLQADECLQLLREQSVGRVAFDGPSGLTVLPLAYRVQHGMVLLRTAAGTELAQLPEGTPVAFEVDEFDAELADGWSVLVRGRLARASWEALAAGSDVPLPFVPGERDVLLHLVEQRLSGRAVSADR